MAGVNQAGELLLGQELQLDEGPWNSTGAEVWGFTPRWLLLALLSVPGVASLFWWMGTRWFDSSLQFFEYHQFTVVIAGIIAGGYQLYFWVQRNNLHKPALCMKISLDDRIPFWPTWVWFYSFLYFVMIGLTVVSIQDLAEGIHFIFGGLILLASGSAIFYFFPTEVPESFRQFEVNSLSTRYLDFSGQSFEIGFISPDTN